jgi:hypothetical protein
MTRHPRCGILLILISKLPLKMGQVPRRHGSIGGVGSLRRAANACFFFTVFLDPYERTSLFRAAVKSSGSAPLSLSLVECFDSSHYAPSLNQLDYWEEQGPTTGGGGCDATSTPTQSHFDLSGREAIRPLLRISHANLKPFF